MPLKSYGASSITVLEGLEAVRKRPGMYIGSIGLRGLNHLIYEIVDNSVDEHLAGYCDKIYVSLNKDGSCSVKDNGRGIPVEMHEKGMSAARVVLSTLHAGGKFDNDAYKTSGGLHGVGSSVVNALSSYFELNVYKNGKVYKDAYEYGKPVVDLENGLLPVIGKTKEKGTLITFIPDNTIFDNIYFKADWLKNRLHETAYLNPKLTIIFENNRENEEEKIIYNEPDGIVQYVKNINKSKALIHDVIYFKGEFEGTSLECAIQFVDTFEENILGYCNNIYNQEGGTHISGFKAKFTQLINSYARELGILKEKEANFTGIDTRNGMTAVIALKHNNPIFEGQTKTKLASAEAGKAVSNIVGEELSLIFDRNVELIKSIISCAQKSAKIRKAEERTKNNMLTKSKFSFDSNGKLANCDSKNPEECELFIVEGNSAGGSAKGARNRKFQAILPIRGKILNVEKASMDKVLANAEIKTIINTLGCGFSEGYGNDFDIGKLRYNKVILLTDADIDGSHIDTLLLTFLYRFMPELIYNGNVYIAMPPLYKVIEKSGKSLYLYDDKALSKYKKTHKGSFTLQRYKGLGEMDSQQLWETTLNPENRVLKRVEIEDGAQASYVTELLMGNDVAPRKQFIYDHALEADIDM